MYMYIFAEEKIQKRYQLWVFLYDKIANKLHLFLNFFFYVRVFLK